LRVLWTAWTSLNRGILYSSVVVLYCVHVSIYTLY